MPSSLGSTRFGIPSLDEIFNGGIQIGSFILIDSSENLTKVFTKAFLGEGSANKDHLFVYSENPSLAEIGNIKRIGNLSARGSITVRYETFNKNCLIDQPYTIETVTSNMNYKDLKHSKLDCSTEDFYHHLWRSIKEDIKEAGSHSPSRVIIHDIFGIGWQNQSLSEIFEFLKAIKTLLKSQNAICMVTASYRKLNPHIQDMLFQACDVMFVGDEEKISIQKSPRSIHLTSKDFVINSILGAPVLEVA